MMHGLFGKLNPKNAYMKRDAKCKNHYPKSFSDLTIISKTSYPICRRRNTGETIKVRGASLDNRWVISYNPYLLAKYDCHIYVEICSTIKVVKYLYKYIYKGHDRVAIACASDDNKEVVDEITLFQSTRWISPPEETWRIFTSH